MSNVEVKAGQVYIDVGDGDNTRRRLTEHGDVELHDGQGWVPSAVSDANFRRYVASGAFVPEAPDPLPALLAAARKVQNLLDEVARHRIDGMDVLASALWDDVMEAASELRTALTAYEQQQ